MDMELLARLDFIFAKQAWPAIISAAPLCSMTKAISISRTDAIPF